MEYTIPTSLEDIGARLEALADFWEHWGFEPWELGPFTGVSRGQHFIKDGFLGRIAEYKAWDCIVWGSATEADRDNLWRTVRPMDDVMTQRFVFVLPDPWTTRRIKSFYAGLRGYVEFYAYFPTLDGGAGTKEVKDLTTLVDMGLRLSLTGHAAPGAEK